MTAYYNHKKLDQAEYLEWLNTFVYLLNDFTVIAEKASPNIDPKMVAFLRTAEHVFNFFINHRSTYEHEINSDEIEKSVPVVRDYHHLKFERDKVADRIADIIESDPAILKRFENFCDNLKEPRTLGCCL